MLNKSKFYISEVHFLIYKNNDAIIQTQVEYLMGNYKNEPKIAKLLFEFVF